MIVVDTNLIVYLIMPTEYTEMASQVFLQDADWVAPHLWRSEFRNVLAKYLRQQLVSLPQAQKIMQQAEKVMFENEYGSNSDEVLRLVAGSSCSAYDCEFVALAQEFGVPLVTVDKQVLREFPQTAVSPATFLIH
ncbi:MAG: type II toxin-antitoxin system VapC family toxin [Chloroflexota bacterium]|nr:type II toxin-antitoxin system VapC family toxin [Anaerolineales bacterium]MCA9974276.1 type II toxin-antitoxin system VapC family toxin [Anaerolineales bacterium]MCB8966939.1 type II toxin-antitoxin system VapC family toxin [Ardenticatenaceae bacterium]